MAPIRTGQVLWIDGDTPLGRFISFAEAKQKLDFLFLPIRLPASLHISCLIINVIEERICVFSLYDYRDLNTNRCSRPTQEQLRKWLTN